MKLVKMLFASPFAAMGAAFLTVNAAETTTTWQGPDGGDLADAANWNGNPPQYDAETNPDTKLYFKTSPAESYGVTLLQNLTAYSAKFASGVALDVDLNGKTLQFVSDVAFDALTANKPHILLPGSQLALRNGSVLLASPDGSVTNKFYFMEDAANARIGRNSSLTLDNVTGGSDFDVRTTNIVITLKNGTKWNGNYYTFDGYKYGRVLVTGAGTVWNGLGRTFTLNGRNNANANHNAFIVTDHAVVTNFSLASLGSNRFDLEITDGARFEPNGNYALTLPGGTLKIANGNEMKPQYLHLATSGGMGIGEISGSGTRLTLAGRGDGYKEGVALGYTGDASNSRLWIHDGAVVSNVAGDVHFTCAGMGTNMAFEVTDHATLYTSQPINMHKTGLKQARLVFDNCSTGRCFRFFFGASGVAHTNLLWIGDRSALHCTGYLQGYAGNCNTMVISNGTLSADGDISLSSDLALVLAGQRPQVKGGFSVIPTQTAITFDMPAEGYATDQALLRTHNNKLVMTGSSAVFNLEAFLRHGEEKKTFTLIHCPSTITCDDATLERWQAALPPRGCKLEFSADKHDLLLTCKPLKGLMIILR